MTHKPRSKPLADAIQVLRELVQHPKYGWRSHREAAFVIYYWPAHDVADWLGEPTEARRAFRGLDMPEIISRIARALCKAGELMAKFGFRDVGQKEIQVFLWDPDIDLPDFIDKRGDPRQARRTVHNPQRLEVPVTMSLPDGTVVLLPTAARPRDCSRTAEWLEAAAVHEVFHAILREWLGLHQTEFLFDQKAWRKIEEMCAVWLETFVFPGNKTHLDYGRSWLATLMLSHVFDLSGEFEDYSHYVLLASLQHLTADIPGPDHWLPKFWCAAKNVSAENAPWPLLDDVTKECGGLGAAFLRAMEETFSETPEIPVILEIVEEFGGPALVVLGRDGASKRLWLPPLAGHIYRLMHDATQAEVVVRIHGPRDDLEQMRVSVSRNGSAMAQVPFNPVGSDTYARVATVPKEKGESLNIIVCHVGLDGESVQVHVQSR